MSLGIIILPTTERVQKSMADFINIKFTNQILLLTSIS